MAAHRPDAEFSPLTALAGWGFTVLVGTLGASVVAAATGYVDVSQTEWPLWVRAVSLVPLWVAALVVVVYVSRRYGSGDVKADYGFRVEWRDALIGLPIGVIVQLVFVQALYKLLGLFIDTSALEEPARNLTDQASGKLGLILLVLMVVVGAPIVEELLFRGLVLRSFQARIDDRLALLATSALFALAHFQPLQFAGLLLFGLVAGWLAQRFGRLGPSIFAHAGFNAAAVVALLWFG